MISLVQLDLFEGGHVLERSRDPNSKLCEFTQFVYDTVREFEMVDGDADKARENIGLLKRNGYPIEVEYGKRDMSDFEVLKLYHEIRSHILDRGRALFPRREID